MKDASLWPFHFLINMRSSCQANQLNRPSYLRTHIKFDVTDMFWSLRFKQVPSEMTIDSELGTLGFATTDELLLGDLKSAQRSLCR